MTRRIETPTPQWTLIYNFCGETQILLSEKNDIFTHFIFDAIRKLKYLDETAVVSYFIHDAIARGIITREEILAQWEHEDLMGIGD